MNGQRLLLLLFLFAATKLSAQKLIESNFDHYTAAAGLSNNVISGITQDSTGYIWIATGSGLNRFNGTRFAQFHSTSDSLSLTSEVLNGMAWLDKQRLAIYEAGVHIINTVTGETHNIVIPYHDRQYQYKFNMIVKCAGDEQGNIYVLSRSGFYHFDKNYNLVSRFDFYTDEEVPLSHFFFGRELMVLDEKRFLIISVDGLYLYEKYQRKLRKMQESDFPLMAEFLNYAARPYTFLQPRPGEFFIIKAESDTLVYVDIPGNRKVVSHIPINPTHKEFRYRTKLLTASDNEFYITSHFSGFFKFYLDSESGKVTFNTQKHFDSYLCNVLFKDRENNLWIATNKGVFRQNPLRARVQLATVPVELEEKFPELKLDDICVTANKVYVASRADGGLLIFDKKTFRFERQILFDKYQKKGNNIYGLAMVSPNSFLLGTDGPLLQVSENGTKEIKLTPPEWHDSYWTNDLYRDSKGDIWISAYNVYRYKPSTHKFKLVPNYQRLLRVPAALQEDTAGNIWMAGHGLARYNTVKDTIDLILDSFPYIRMPDKQVGTMVIDQYNTIWFNSNNNGLTGYNIDKKTFRHFTHSNGLPDDNMASLTIVGDQLWIACFTGLACMDLRTYRIVSFGKEDGFPDMPVMKGARFFYDSIMRQLYLSFSTAIVRFDPLKVLQPKLSPHMFIESLVMNGKKTLFLPLRDVTTPWQDNEVRVTIGTINFSDGANQRFAYRMVRDSLTPWTIIGSQPSFSISSLSPGRHLIQVKAFSPSNRWTEQVQQMSITVLPPFWQQTWFVLLMSVVIFVLLYLLIKWRTGLVRKKEMQKTHIEKLKADDYKNQFELEQISNYFSSSLTDKKTEEEVLWDVTQNLIGRMNYVDCIIYMWNEDKTKMVQKAAYGPKGEPGFISDQQFDVLPGQGIVGQVIETLQPVLVSDTRMDSRYRVDDQFRLSEVTVPIIHNDELLGVLDSEHHQANYFTERDIKILTTIATLLANKLKQIESEQSLDAKRKELANINQQLAEARLSALQAQMNPHFVFNALNSIKRMILDGDNETASRYLSKFALMIRMTLNHSKEIFVTLDENIDYLRAYLEMEQLRFDETFTYSISVADNIEVAETPIPSMMMQPLVENAIWHGLMQAGSTQVNPADKPDKKIRISFTQEENRLICMVEDNGIGIRQSERLKEKNKSPHQSVGLENLRKRIRIMNDKYDMDCCLCMYDLAEIDGERHGTRVVLEFNLINV
jgi:ligand-binding sensor domain-containing protein/putative methionine-R-sulfoxide reductase with GAF domain